MNVRYTTHKNLRTKLRQLKKYNEKAKILGLDVGTKYTGIAVSCNDLYMARGLKTLVMP